MGLKSSVISYYAKYVRKNMLADAGSAVFSQIQILKDLVAKAGNTSFGKNHRFYKIRDYGSFKEQVRIRDYEDLRPYIDQIIDGGRDVLWPGRPRYFAKTSGTTSGVKYIPITRDSIPNHIHTARNALFNRLLLKNDFTVFDGKMIFLSGSPDLHKKGPILTGRLSGIVNHEVPFWVKGNQLPKYHTNCIEDWEQKVEKIIVETKDEDLRLISGIPPWVQMYFERLLAITGKKSVKEVYPNFQQFMFGGVDYKPYQAVIEKLIGDPIDSIELYPASEGFIAFQDSLENEGLLLNTNSGIFYEFVPLEEAFKEMPVRYSLEEVELERDYAVIITNNAGLWAYNLGDTVRFVSLNPYRIIVSGRVKHFISAFGEHVIGKEVEEAMLHVANTHGINITEFTVAPQVNPGSGELPYHEWFVEFEDIPTDLTAFARKLDQKMTEQNIYYKDLIDGKILQPLQITALKKEAFRHYMKSQGKLGGQNKVPRLANDRTIADKLSAYALQTKF